MLKSFSKQAASKFSTLVDLTDVFGQLPNLRVLKKNKQKSVFGFVMTIILMTVAASYLLTEIISMLKKSQPSMFASEQLIFDTPTYELKEKNFTLAVSVVDEYANPFVGLGRYYDLYIQQCTRARIEDENSGNISIKLDCKQIPFEACNMTHFQTDLQQKYFSKFKFGSLQCINSKFLQETPPILKGQQSSSEYTFLALFLTKCRNTTKSQNCASEEEISKKLKSAIYNVFSSDYLLQLERSDDPLVQIITPNFVSFSSTTSKKIVQYYQIIETTTDDGILFQNTKVQTNLKKGQMEPYSEIYNGEYLIQHMITIQAVQTNYFRSYIKLQTILAKIGGICQLLIMVASTLFQWLLQDLMLLKVSNKLFNFQDCTNQDQSIIGAQENYQKNEKFPTAFHQALCVILGCDKKRKKQFTRSKNEILKNLDIVKIIKKLQKCETFIRLFINESQHKALVALSKPHIEQADNQQNLMMKGISSSSSTDQKTLLGKSGETQFFTILPKLKENKLFGLEKEINAKLISEIEKKYFQFIIFDLKSPKTPKTPKMDKEQNSFGVDINEPQSQRIK